MPILDSSTARYLEAHPEEATTLGVRAHDGRWGTRRHDDLSVRARSCRADLTALATDPASTTVDGRMLRAHLLAEARRVERGDVLASLEHAVLPHAILRFQAMQCRAASDWSRVVARAETLPELLSAQQDLLRRGVAQGRPADAAIAQSFLDHELPQSIEDLDALASWSDGEDSAPHRAALDAAGADAARAYREFASFLQAEIVPLGASSYALGRDDVAERLRGELGLSESPEELASRFEAMLPALEEDLLRACRDSAQTRGESVDDLPQARALVGKLFGQTLTADDDPLARYAQLTKRAEEFCVERGLYRLPAGYDLRIRPMPAHRIGHVSSTNWPAPARDASQPGHLLVSPRPGDHSLANLALLAVHEATPGHYLQSVGFQACFGLHESLPARLLGMTDELAMASCFFGPMLAIEGFAVRAEEVMAAAGFFDADTRVLEAASRIIRALRVVTDIRLHTGEMSRAQAAELLAARTGFPLAWGQAQSLRYSRIPLQALTYAVGADRLAALEGRRRNAAGPHFDLASFHEEVIAQGPIPPDWMYPEADSSED